MNQKTQSMTLIMVAYASTLVGCGSLSQIRENSRLSNAVPVGNVLVGTWLGKQSLAPLNADANTLGNVLARAGESLQDNLNRQAAKQLAENAPQQPQTAQLRNALQADLSLLKISRHQRDWYLPRSLVAETSVAGMTLQDGDRVMTVPFAATEFAAPSDAGKTQPETLELMVAGLSKIQGKVRFESPTSHFLADIAASTGTLFPAPNEYQKFLGSDEKSMAASALANTVVVSRLGADGRLKSMIVPGIGVADFQSQNAFQVLSADGQLQSPLISGDLVEIAILDLYMARSF